MKREERGSLRSSKNQAPWTLDLDADNDGQISPDELMKDFQRVHFRADVMLERVSLEDGLLGFMQQYTALGLQSAPVWTNATVTTSGSHRLVDIVLPSSMRR